MPQLTPTEFLIQLAALLTSRKDKGSVFITQKRLTYTPEASTSTAPPPAAISSNGAGGAGGEEDVEMSELATGEAGAGTGAGVGEDEREYPLLIRATDGEGKKDVKVKISCVVSPDEFDSFSLAYYALLRSTFHSGLRPKRKKASATASAEAKAKKAAKKAARVAAGGGGGVQAEERKVKEVKGVFTPRLPKVIGPRRGNGVKKRRRLEKRREKVVASWKASKARKAGGE